MKHLKVLGLFLFLVTQLNAQIIIDGTVIDADSKESISYVNIGVVNQKIGTVSDQYGNFSLNVISSDAVINFSSIGFETINRKATEFEKENLVALVPKKYNLKTVEITSQAFEKEEVMIGVRNETRGKSITIGSPQLGAEIGTVLKIKKTTFVKSANFVLNHAKGDSLLFRINIYDFSDRNIGENLLKENILLLEKQRKGTITVDLESYGIILKSDVLLTLEWLRDFDELGSKGITFDTKKSRKNGGIYMRGSSNAEMIELSFQKKFKTCFYLIGKQTKTK